ncbi:hypothetical protein NBX27_00285 [Erysipelothrix rhusiopathiae]|uniref:hypothetical protein n=1 Tax=Erysipelothrix rhusiopathiae TaxID=1648 RepID=UPI00202B334D|nr:hypothetical protein [Erysipelothrix rhusiopathiae]URQ77347.1 hypothetical protein NBX27_00285 [Erysipelothrix rhusiopathiae]
MTKKYCVSYSALAKWIKQYLEVAPEDDSIMTAKQIKDLQKRNAKLEEENLVYKNNCHIHAPLKQGLDAIHALRFQHTVKLLCKTLEVKRSTYYKRFFSVPANRTLENKKLCQLIIGIYHLTKKHLGAGKIKTLQSSDYGIHISVARIQRLMTGMQPPKMSTVKPKHIHTYSIMNFEYVNHIKQKFNVQHPN